MQPSFFCIMAFESKYQNITTDNVEQCGKYALLHEKKEQYL